MLLSNPIQEKIRMSINKVSYSLNTYRVASTGRYIGLRLKSKRNTVTWVLDILDIDSSDGQSRNVTETNVLTIWVLIRAWAFLRDTITGIG